MPGCVWHVVNGGVVGMGTLWGLQRLDVVRSLDNHLGCALGYDHAAPAAVAGIARTPSFVLCMDLRLWGMVGVCWNRGIARRGTRRSIGSQRLRAQELRGIRARCVCRLVSLDLELSMEAGLRLRGCEGRRCDLLSQVSQVAVEELVMKPSREGYARMCWQAIW
jgi:hypothetical protein